MKNYHKSEVEVEDCPIPIKFKYCILDGQVEDIEIASTKKELMEAVQEYLDENIEWVEHEAMEACIAEREAELQDAAYEKYIEQQEYRSPVYELGR